MRIAWAPNPLRTVVELDDADRWALREGLEMDHGEEDDPAWMNRLFDDCVAALADAHIGDCTCVPCSCLKCWAESYLGIDTMPGLGKYLAYKVNDAFGSNNERTLDEAIAGLANYNPVPTSPMWDGRMQLWNDHLPRWKDEAKLAHAWLAGYRDEHFTTEAGEARGVDASKDGGE